MEEFF